MLTFPAGYYTRFGNDGGVPIKKNLEVLKDLLWLTVGQRLRPISNGFNPWILQGSAEFKVRGVSLNALMWWGVRGPVMRVSLWDQLERRRGPLEIAELTISNFTLRFAKLPIQWWRTGSSDWEVLNEKCSFKWMGPSSVGGSLSITIVMLQLHV